MRGFDLHLASQFSDKKYLFQLSSHTLKNNRAGVPALDEAIQAAFPGILSHDRATGVMIPTFNKVNLFNPSLQFQWMCALAEQAIQQIRSRELR